MRYVGPCLLLLSLLTSTGVSPANPGGPVNPTPPELDPELQKLVDPILHWRRPTVAPEQNAWTDWRHAIKAYVTYEQAGISHEFHDVKLRQGDHWLDNPADVARVNVWLEANAAAFDRIDRGSQRGDLQRDTPTTIGTGPAAHLGANLYKLAELRHTRARIRARQEDTAGALDDALANLRMAHRLRQSNRLVQWAQGCAVEDLAHRAFQDLSAQLTPAQRTQAMAALTTEKDPHDRLRSALRHEFWRSFMAEVEPHAGLPGNARQTTLAYLAHETGAEADQVDTLIGDKHSAFFDRNQTIRLGSNYFARQAKNIGMPWSKRDPAVYHDLDQLSSRVSDRFKALGELIKEPRFDNSPVAEQQRAAQLGAISPNLIGEHLAVTFTPSFDRMELINHRLIAARQAMRITLAVHSYETHHGRPPADLDTLVKTKPLQAIPDDPFSDSPMRYDPRRRLIWSVGKDGKDHGGQGFPDDPDKRHHGDDLAWRIAPLPSSVIAD